MARPSKTKLDYFPLYCDYDERTEYLVAKFGFEGYGVYISLLKRIYGGKGYYLNWNDKAECIFSAAGKISSNKTKEIINCLLDEGIFNKEIYEKHSVLTSKEIQENYLYAISKRKNITIDMSIRLVDSEETTVNSAQTPVYSSESTQRKENKIIKNNTIEERENREDNCVVLSDDSHAPSQEKPRGEYMNVFLTEQEYSELKASYDDIDSSVERLSQYMAASGKSYASHYAVLRKWAQEDENKQTVTKAAPRKRESSFDIDEWYRLAGSQDIRACLT